jgi:U32 family peptidase
MKHQSEHKPELLLPVGNIDSFYAAIDGGADAIYLGLKSFNARNRAMNFTPWQVAAMVKEARKRKIKSYITLNTVIRNFELESLIHTLNQIHQIQPDGVIVQDVGVLYLIKKFFPELNVHASTQMAIHNSAGVDYANQKGIKRVVLARELTFSELKEITSKSKTEIELFVHGALCYSFSGMCLFSSYLGGASANRGLCTQPCRRIYSQNNIKEEKGIPIAIGRKEEKYFFSLKDNQLIDHLDELKELGITSLKVEGRLKSGDYVQRVAKAYRMAIDFPEKTEEARAMLEQDLGREKTSYFLGKEVANAITQAATSGILIGKVIKSEAGRISFTSNLELENGSRLRFRNPQNDKQVDLKADTLIKENETYSIEGDPKEIKQTYEVYLAGNKLKLPQKINTDGIQIKEHYSPDKVKNILNNLRFKGNPSKQEIYLRIDNIEWFDKIKFEDFSGVIVQLSISEWEKFPYHSAIIQKNKEKIHAELPKFIPEGKISFYSELTVKLSNSGINSFFISHLSQKLILPDGARLSTNENVYTLNDAAIKFLKEESIQKYIYPLENDIANLGKGTDRNGIIPVYFYPHLFYSRMPVKVEQEEIFTDKNGEKFRKHVRDGMTIVIPANPVSFTQYHSKLERFGFNRFLIDMSFTKPSKETLQTVLTTFMNSETVKGSNILNFKRELK